MTNQSNAKKSTDNEKFLYVLSSVGIALMDTVVEIYLGVKQKTIPYARCLTVGLVLLCLCIARLDMHLLSQTFLRGLYPTTPPYYQIYFVLLGFAGFFVWGTFRLVTKTLLLKRLNDVLTTASLTNALGKLPTFKFDRPVDSNCRILSLYRANLPLEKFVSAKSWLESGLQVFIDEIRENRKAGTVDVLYALDPLPSIVKANVKMLASLGSILAQRDRNLFRAILMNVLTYLLLVKQVAENQRSYGNLS